MGRAAEISDLSEPQGTYFPGQGHSFNHCVAKNNTSWATEIQWGWKEDPSGLEGSFLKKGSVATPKLTLCCLTKIKANS